MYVEIGAKSQAQGARQRPRVARFLTSYVCTCWLVRVHLPVCLFVHACESALQCVQETLAETPLQETLAETPLHALQCVQETLAETPLHVHRPAEHLHR